MKKKMLTTSDEIPSIHCIGGKAHGLIQLISGGFPVPPMDVLSVDFFSEWYEMLNETLEESGIAFEPEYFYKISQCLKGKVSQLDFSAEQLEIVKAIAGQYKEQQLFAVRSSSTEEDGQTLSFAGVYKTILGVTKENLMDAIKDVFASSFAERVFYYKHQNKMPITNFSFGVIIQEQLDAQSSGVGFSINPVSNSYDEAVISANTGLGESVVSGMITPDELVVDKQTLKVTSENIGTKEKAIYLLPEGSTEIRDGIGNEAVLGNGQIHEITEIIMNIESFYGYPIDIEWAYSNDKLYVLQARAITAYTPLPEDLITEPGEPKRLNMDISLTGQGMTEPISYLGCDVIKKLFIILYTQLFGMDTISNYKEGFSTVQWGRMYMNLSNMVKMQKQKNIASITSIQDYVAGEMIRKLDLSEYIPKKKPRALKGFIWSSTKANMGMVRPLLKAIRHPEKYMEDYLKIESEFEEYLDLNSNTEGFIETWAADVFKRCVAVVNASMQMFYAAELARFRIKRMFRKDKGLMEKLPLLSRSLEGNITIEMGLTMYEISQFDEIKESTFESFMDMLGNDQCSVVFIVKWNHLLKKFGFRSIMEMDVARARPAENIEEMYNQVKAMSMSTGSNNPLNVFQESVKLREETYEEVRQALHNSRKLRRFEKQYNTLLAFGGYRETPKYWMIKSLYSVRKVILNRGCQLVDEGKLKSLDDVFFLSLAEIDLGQQIHEGGFCDLMGERKDYYKKLDAVKHFPRIIDSRGKILRPPSSYAGDNAYKGEPISPGRVTGRVRILKSMGDKPLEPGEILVTEAADPGWTMLFINASAILLEIGGMLQHGAQVAREYGKPCITGLVGITDQLSDGQMIEVDADNGIVKILDETKGTGEQ